MYRPLNFAVCFLALLSSVVTLSAQQPVGSVSGTVADERNTVIPGITLEFRLESEADTNTFKTVRVSDEKGNFKVENLPAGIYSVKAELLGRSYKNGAVRVYPSQDTKLDIRLTYKGCERVSEDETVQLSDSDKADIVNRLLELSLSQGNVPDFEMLKGQKGAIIVSAANIKAEWLRPLPNLNITVLDQSDIQEKADRKGDFLYISVGKFEVSGKCVIVALNNSWAVGKKSGTGYLSGGGLVFVFRKESGKWIGESVGGWIS